MTTFPHHAPDERDQALQRVLALRELGRAREAAAELTRALARAPEDAELWRLLSQLHGDLNEDEQALQAAQRAVGLAPDESDAHLTLGTALWNSRVKGRVLSRVFKRSAAWRSARLALAELEEALRLEPEHSGARLSLADLHLLMNQPEQAYPLLVSVLQTRPQHPEAQVRLAQVWLQRKQPAAAEKILRALLAHDPAFTQALNVLSQVHLRQGLAEQAFEAALAAIRLDPADQDAQNHFKTMVNGYLPLPFSWQSGVWRVAVVPHAVALVPFMALAVWLRTLHRLSRLSPELRVQVLRARSTFELSWRSPLVIWLLAGLTLTLIVWLPRLLPPSLQAGGNELAGGLIFLVMVDFLLGFVLKAVLGSYHWLRSLRA